MQASPLQIVLASQSPRRLELAQQEGWNVRVFRPPDSAEERAPARTIHESLEAWVARLARTKAATALAGLHPHALESPPAGDDEIIVACDTIGVIDDEPLGKPGSRQEAAEMLRRLSGRVHRVLTGSCLWPPSSPPWLAVTESILEMQPLSSDVLAAYLDSGLWQGKAGACGYQDAVIPLVLLAGSGANVIGLPVETLRNQLAEIQKGRYPADRGAAPGFEWFPA
jgi:septum formation protein